MLSNTIRTKFLKFFKDHGHTIVPSSPIFPHNDPSILFTNAGMNQFKNVFLGKEKLDYKKASTSQKCIRAGGKHNDLDNVGHTSRHLTFFEMLGNFSFGDYFKKEAIDFAWNVSLEVFGLDSDKIVATVHYKDNESFELWTKYLPSKKIIRLGDKDNFWSMAETGPCGPCSELLYDRGPAFGKSHSPEDDVDGERFLEYWNLVFMEYDRNEKGDYIPLPQKSVDTGAGLERLISLVNGVGSVFDSDVLRELITQIEIMSGHNYLVSDSVFGPSFRVIADHIRSLSFAIADGLRPGNTDRSYVIRKILRRAVNYGRRLNIFNPFLSELVPTVSRIMGGAYPQLKESERAIQEVLHTEEEIFLRTLKRGGAILSNILDLSKTTGVVSGTDAFKLKDTYGLPLEEIVLLAKDNGLTVDMDEYLVLEQRAKEISRATTNKPAISSVNPLYETILKKEIGSEFLGYDSLSTTTSILSIISDDSAIVSSLHQGCQGALILKCTPFYSERGGQIGDRGLIKSEHGIFEVTDTQSPVAGIVIHRGKVTQGCLSEGEVVNGSVDSVTRMLISVNHTACHLLHKALEIVLGPHIKQAGSFVDDKKLRLDFMHPQSLSKNQLLEIERLVNRKIRENIPIHTYEENYQKVLLREDIKQFFGDKYDSVVRVVDIDFSKELCGGTHTNRTGDIGIFKIVKESSVSAGVRRIEAVTGSRAESIINATIELLNESSDMLSTPASKFPEKLKSMLKEIRDLKARTSQLEEVLVSHDVNDSLTKIKILNHIKLLHLHLPTEKGYLIQKYSEILHTTELCNMISIFSVNKDNRCILLTRISDDLVEQGLHADSLLKYILEKHNGKWGGKKQTAQGSCSIINLDNLAELTEKWIVTH